MKAKIIKLVNAATFNQPMVNQVIFYKQIPVGVRALKLMHRAHEFAQTIDNVPWLPPYRAPPC